MNNVFISYAGADRNIAKDLCLRINSLLGENFYSELIEDRKQGDTTFTEKVVNYFKICNVFVVLLTEESLKNQFVNQEWGYARCLKEIGQIQLLFHITKLDHSGKRIESSGFISTNMDFINLSYDKDGKPLKEGTILETIEFLKSRESELIPIIPEKQQKLQRFIEEIDRNLSLTEDIISGRESFEKELSINPLQFRYDYALQLLQVGHLFPKSLCREIENYIDLLKEIYVLKDQLTIWAICRGKYHSGNWGNFQARLDKAKIFLIEIKSLSMNESGLK